MTGIIFDIDGTLWDTSDIIAISYNEVLDQYLHRHDIVITGADIKRNLGKSMYDFIEGIFPMLTKKERAIVLEPCATGSVDILYRYPPTLFDGVKEVFRKLKSAGYPLYIVSNCHDGYIEALLTLTDSTDYINDYLCSGVTGKTKGENIQMIIERNHLSSAVYVGDTFGDYQSCQHAGIPFIWAKYGFGHVPDARYSIQSIQELIPYLDQIHLD